MRKHIKNSSKRKWVVGGVAFFGAVALLTTGFASWVIGAMQTEQYPGVSVGVDTVKDSSVIFEMSLTEDAIYASEAIAVSGEKILNTEEPMTAQDFTVAYSYSLTHGNDYLVDSEHAPNAIKLTIDTTATGNTAVNTASAETGAVSLTEADVKDEGTLAGTHDATGTYLSLYDGQAAATEVYIALTGSAGDFEGTGSITFTWGTFFGNVSPCAYYNAIDYANINDAQAKVVAEMEAFHTNLNSKKLMLKAEVAYHVFA